VRQQIGALVRPQKSVPAALALSVIPGAGQIYAGSKLRGALTILLVGGAAWLGAREISAPGPCFVTNPPPEGCFKQVKPNDEEAVLIISSVMVLSMIDAAITAARRR
jgi:hypothetical protein